MDEIADVEMMLAQVRITFGISDEMLVKEIEKKFAKLGKHNRRLMAVLTGGIMSEDKQTVEIADSNEIKTPLECMLDIQYTAPCKMDENSYIRTLGLLSVEISKQLLTQLDIIRGGKAELTLEGKRINPQILG